MFIIHSVSLMHLFEEEIANWNYSENLKESIEFLSMEIRYQNYKYKVKKWLVSRWFLSNINPYFMENLAMTQNQSLRVLLAFQLFFMSRTVETGVFNLKSKCSLWSPKNFTFFCFWLFLGFIFCSRNNFDPEKGLKHLILSFLPFLSVS